MSLAGQTLTVMWKKFSGICDKVYNRPGILNIRNMDFETYMVTCPQTAKKIREWAQKKNHAEKAIDAYLTAEFSTKILGVDGPVYKLDDTGHIAAIRLRNWMPLTHTGWEAKNINTNWLVPIKPKTGIKKGENQKEHQEKGEKEDRATRYLREQTMLGERKREELQALPAAPSYKILKELINWPDMQPEPWEEEAMDHGFTQYAHASDRLLTPFGFDNHVFIEVPKASSFDTHPAIQEKIKSWNKPEFLTPISGEDITALEKQFEQKKLQGQQKNQLNF